jgi:hypothetical protein
VKDSGNRVETAHVRTLLNERAVALCDEAIRTGGHVSPEQLEVLGRLARLVEIRGVAEPSRPRARWPIVTLLGITLAIVSILLFARVRTTEIELDVSVSEVSFGSPRQQVLADAMTLSTLGVSGLQEIQLPRSGGRDAQTLRASDGPGSAIRLSTGSDSGREATVTLATLSVPAGTRVWLRSTAVPQEYRLSIKSPPLVLRADVSGQVEVGLPHTPREQLRFVPPKSILLRSGSEEVDVNFRFPSRSTGSFSPYLSADAVSLVRVDELLGAEQTVVRRVSTVLSGTLYFESLGGQERRLRPGERIEFESSIGEIRTLRLADTQIAFGFHGQVSGMTTGRDANRISLMPTYLEWLRARHSLSLLWGSTLYLFGLAVTTVRWWRTSP